MTNPVICVSPATDFKSVAERLRARSISALPVVDQVGMVIGVVSEADLLPKEDRTALETVRHPLRRRGIREARAKAAARTARELMTSPALTIGPDAPVAEAARLMLRRGVKRLPVVDEFGKALGIVSRGDLIGVFTREDGEILREVAQDVIAKTLLLDPDALDVTVARGVVHLRGETNKRSEAVLVERLAGQVDGVVSVSSELTFLNDDSEPAPNPQTEPIVYPIRF